MKIAYIYASNVMRLKLAEVRLDGKHLVIAGKNEQGKSSFLQSVFIALAGKKAEPVDVIHHGEKKTEIFVDLTEDFRIEKTIYPDKTELVVRPIEDQEHKLKLSSPQSILNKLFSQVTFDPLEFEHLKADEQIKILKQFLPDPAALDKIESKIAQHYALRTDINSELKTYDLDLKKMEKPEMNLPEKEVSIADLSKQLQQLNKEAQNKVNLRDGIKKLQEDLEENLKIVASLQKQIDDLNSTINHTKSSIEIKEKEFKELPVYAPKIKVLEEQINNAESINKKIRNRDAYINAQNKSSDAKIRSDEETQVIEELRKLRKQIFEDANMPVESLSFNEEGVYLGDVPFTNLSQSRKSLTSMKIGMALHSDLTTMFSKYANDFDDERIKTLFAMADAEGYQFIVERINPVEGLPYIIIDDGLVVDEGEKFKKNKKLGPKKEKKTKVVPPVPESKTNIMEDEI